MLKQNSLCIPKALASIRVSLLLAMAAAAQVPQSPRLAGQDRELVAAELVQSLPNTSQHITPLAPRSSRFQYLNPGLTDAPDWLAGQAVTAVTSPDGGTLLVLTSGYNRFSYTDGPKAGSTNPAASTEHVFVYDISRNTPVKKQVIHVPNTYQGIVFDPGGKSFYVPGGVDDNLHTYSLQANGMWAEDLSSPTKLNHTSGAGMSVSPEAAGIDITRDGSTIVVSNYYNDSVSVLSRSGGGTWTASTEVDLRPGKADPSMAGVPGGEYPLWVSIKGNDTAYVSSIRDREIVIVSLTGKAAVTGRIKLTGQPLKMALNGAQSMLYVAEDQTDSVAVIDTAANRLVTEIAVGAPAGLLPDSRAQFTGHGTNNVALSPDGSTLYVVNGNMNNIAVVSVSGLMSANPVQALIPTGWYPNSVAFSGDGKYLYVVNGKSPTGPNGSFHGVDALASLPNVAPASNQYGLQLIKAGLQTMPVPGPDQFAILTEQVAENNHFRRDLNEHDWAVMSFLRSKIKHVIYIIKENRTYDQILGDLEWGDGDPTLTEYGETVTPNEHTLARQFVTFDRFYATAEVSMDGWPWTTGARALDVVEKQLTVNYAGRGLTNDSTGQSRNVNVALATVAERKAASPSYPNDPDLLPGQMNLTAPDGPGAEANTGYLWNQALRAGLAVRNYGFFVANVGTPSPDPYSANTVMVTPADAALKPYTDLYFRGYDLNVPDNWRYSEWARDYDSNVAAGSVPSLTLIRMGENHTGNFGTALAKVNTPELQVADNDYAVGRVVERVAQSPYADSTLIFVIEDDAQNGGDHVDSHRTTAFIVGPWVKQRALVSTPYNTLSMFRTIEEVLGLVPLNLNDSIAVPMTEAFDTSEANWSYTAAPSLLLYNTDLTLPPAPPQAVIPKPTHNAAYWARVTRGMNFDEEDRVDFVKYNRIIWAGLKGKRPYPAGLSVHGSEDKRERQSRPLPQSSQK